jgi:H+-transporting ATPase
LQTLDFLMLVFTGQATVYLVRERKHFWQSRPGRFLIASSLLDVAIVILLATNGVLMPRITILPIIELLAGTILFMVLLDAIKIRIFQWFGIR